MNDLDWLARNVHEWGWAERGENFYIQKYKDDSYGFVYFHRREPWMYTFDQWLTRRAELQGKPSWSTAPDDAEWLAMDSDGWWSWFDRKPEIVGDEWPGNTEEGYITGIRGKEPLGDWRNTLERRPEKKTFTVDEVREDLGVTEREVNRASVELGFKQWTGPEDGLPPVGTECEFRHPDYGWTGCDVIAYHGSCAVCAPNGGGFYGGFKHDFRPLRTEEDKAVEEMAMVIFKEGFSDDADHVSYARALYRAGYRKIEREDGDA